MDKIEDTCCLELLKVCEELQGSSSELSSVIGRWIHQMQHDRSSPMTPEGLSILEVKNDILLSYIINIVYIMLQKCSGTKLEIEAIRRLIEMQVIFKKLCPIEQKLKHQIEKLLRPSNLNVDTDNNDDKTTVKANPENLNDIGASGSDSEIESDEGTKQLKVKKKSGIYMPPKLAAVSYDDDNIATKQQKMLERARKRALNSSLMQELKEEYLQTPVEMSYTNTLRNKRLKFEEDKKRFEEEYFVRLPVTKKEKQRNKLLSSCTLGKLGADITHFEDLSALDGKVASSSKKKPKKSIPFYKKRKVN